jgi:hypothetical protein
MEGHGMHSRGGRAPLAYAERGVNAVVTVNRCLGDDCPSSVLCGPVGSGQARLGGVSAGCGLVRCSRAWWNVHRNDHQCERGPGALRVGCDQDDGRQWSSRLGRRRRSAAARTRTRTSPGTGWSTSLSSSTAGDPVRVPGRPPSSWTPDPFGGMTQPMTEWKRERRRPRDPSGTGQVMTGSGLAGWRGVPLRLARGEQVVVPLVRSRRCRV